MIARLATLSAVVAVLVAAPFAGASAFPDAAQRTYSPDMTNHIGGLLDGSIPLTKQFMIDDMQVTLTTTLQETKDGTYIVKTVVDHDGVVQDGLGVKYMLQVNGDGTYNVWNNDFNLLVTDEYSRAVTKSVSLRDWVMACDPTVRILGYGDARNGDCFGATNIRGVVTPTYAFIGFDADSVIDWYIFTATYERGYANVVGQEFEFSTNSGTITMSGDYESYNTHVIAGIFFYNVD